MAATIWKFPVQISDAAVVVEMPAGADVLCVHMQSGVATVWAVVDSAAKKERRLFSWLPTGGDGPRDDEAYVGTVLVGPLVWHLFQVVAP